MAILGIDIGGSTIKYGTIHDDLAGWNSVTICKTPNPATPEALSTRVGEIVAEFNCKSVGIAFPAVVKHGIVKSAAHIDDTWLNTDGLNLFRKKAPQVKALLNDADAALLAEHQWGVGRGFAGTILLLTLGTGIGSGMMVDGHLWPNSELGHLQLQQGLEAEAWAAASIRRGENLSWRAWGERLNQVLAEMKRLCHPDTIILGGAISESFDQFSAFLNQDVPVVAASLGNQAGVLGAALAASQA